MGNPSSIKMKKEIIRKTGKIIINKIKATILLNILTERFKSF